MNNKEISKYIALSDRQTEFEFTVKNNYDFSLKRQNIRLDLIEEADGFLVLSYKGLRYPVEIVSRKQNEYEILLNGVAYTFSVETPFSLKRKKSSTEHYPALPPSFPRLRRSNKPHPRATNLLSHFLLFDTEFR